MSESESNSAPSPAKKMFKPNIPPRRVKTEKSPRPLLEEKNPFQPDRGVTWRGQSERRLGAQEASQPCPKYVQVCFTLNCYLLFLQVYCTIINSNPCYL
jgi:hypothetical protein